jgi:hypothetical protein
MPAVEAGLQRGTLVSYPPWRASVEISLPVLVAAATRKEQDTERKRQKEELGEVTSDT